MRARHHHLQTALCSRRKSVRSPDPAAASHTLRVSEALASQWVRDRPCDLASRVLVRGADPSSGEPGWFEGAVTQILRSGPGGGGGGVTILHGAVVVSRAVGLGHPDSGQSARWTGSWMVEAPGLFIVSTFCQQNVPSKWNP
ncbi:unnamed protein product [Rangifer tarandus platyrhynchus]|uniref:Uncharacterized protein n=1 Tax=Rangifer tarandus platyrhynchus TaxID=3082113 RepID=A0AC59YPA6_RANTA